ncbi:response regulator [Sphingomonas natans]|nr:response regulator [Sphingomonas sp. BIUV-7]
MRITRFDGQYEDPSPPTSQDALDLICVDDDDDIRFITRQALNLDANIAIECVSSGRDVLQLLNRRATLPDCLIVDSRMPMMSGEMLMLAVRSDERFKDIKLIVMSANVHRDDLNRYFALGAAGVVGKPFNAMTLASQVREILSSTIARHGNDWRRTA